MKLIAVDVGYSATKALSSDEASAIFPSVVGTPVPEGTFSFNENQRALAVTGNGHYVPVGDTALTQSQYVSGRLDPEWVLSQDWMTLFQAGLSELITTPLAKVNVVVGLPVGDYNRFSVQLKERLVHTFAFRRYGRDTQRVEVTEARVLTQPFGALLDMALDDAGHVRNAQWADGYVGVVDIGGNTMNLLAVDRLAEVPQSTMSDEFGLLRALDSVRGVLRSSFRGFNPDTHEVSEWLAKGSFRYHAEDVDIWPYAEPFLLDLVNVMMTVIHKRWSESGRFDAVLLAGGGAAVIGRYLKSRMQDFANVNIAPNPRWANVRGYLKYARRVWSG